LILVIARVNSVTRTISSSSDDLETFIRNTNGNIWECTGSNIKRAIDDLGGKGGTVLIGSDTTLSEEIHIDNIGIGEGKQNTTIIDFQGTKVTLNSDITFVNLTRAQHVTIKNVHIRPDPDQLEPIIKLYVGATGDPDTKCVSYNTFKNIHVGNTGGKIIVNGLGCYKKHNFTIVHMEMNGESTMHVNTFEDFYVHGVGKFAYFYQKSESGWINDSYFENIWIDQFLECIRFQDNPAATSPCFNYNIFVHVKPQVSRFTKYGITNISGYANRFDHVLMWDWYACKDHTPPYTESGVEEYGITNRAFYTYINAHMWYIGGTDVNDEGINTMVIANGAVRIEAP